VFSQKEGLVLRFFSGAHALTAGCATIEGYNWFGAVPANNQNHLDTVFPTFVYNSFPGIFNDFIRPSQEVQKKFWTRIGSFLR
jgi:hypothetical protein